MNQAELQSAAGKLYQDGLMGFAGWKEVASQIHSGLELFLTDHPSYQEPLGKLMSLYETKTKTKFDTSVCVVCHSRYQHQQKDWTTKILWGSKESVNLKLCRVCAAWPIVREFENGKTRYLRVYDELLFKDYSKERT